MAAVPALLITVPFIENINKFQNPFRRPIATTMFLIGTLVAGSTAILTCILITGTTSASWDYYVPAPSLTYSKGTFTGNGSSTTITITSGRAVDNVLVFVNGICLVPTDDYTISGTTLTFATAPVNLAEITVRYLPI